MAYTSHFSLVYNSRLAETGRESLPRLGTEGVVGPRGPSPVGAFGRPTAASEEGPLPALDRRTCIGAF